MIDSKVTAIDSGGLKWVDAPYFVRTTKKEVDQNSGMFNVRYGKVSRGRAGHQRGYPVLFYYLNNTRTHVNLLA